jgi:hypothetical protein
VKSGASSPSRSGRTSVVCVMSVPFQVIAARLAREHHDARKREFQGGGNPVGPRRGQRA